MLADPEPGLPLTAPTPVSLQAPQVSVCLCLPYTRTPRLVSPSPKGSSVSPTSPITPLTDVHTHMHSFIRDLLPPNMGVSLPAIQ